MEEVNDDDDSNKVELPPLSPHSSDGGRTASVSHKASISFHLDVVLFVFLLIMEVLKDVVTAHTEALAPPSSCCCMTCFHSPPFQPFIHLCGPCIWHVSAIKLEACTTRNWGPDGEGNPEFSPAHGCLDQGNAAYVDSKGTACHCSCTHTPDDAFHICTVTLYIYVHLGQSSELS